MASTHPTADGGEPTLPVLDADGLTDRRALLEADDGSRAFESDYWTFDDPERRHRHVLERREGEPLSGATHASGPGPESDASTTERRR